MKTKRNSMPCSVRFRSRLELEAKTTTWGWVTILCISIADACEMKHAPSPARLFAVRCGSAANSEVLPSSGGTITKTPGFRRETRPQPTALCNRLLAQLQHIMGNVLCAEGDDCIFVQQGNETILLNWKIGSSTILNEGAPSSISDDGRWLVTLSVCRKLTLWALPDRHKAATFTLDAPVLHTALSPDGRFLVAADESGGVYILSRED